MSQRHTVARRQLKTQTAVHGRSNCSRHMYGKRITSDSLFMVRFSLGKTEFKRLSLFSFIKAEMNSMNHKFISRDIDHSLTVICSDLCIFQSDTQFIIQTLYLTPVQGNTLCRVCRLCVLEKSYHRLSIKSTPSTTLFAKSPIVYGPQIRRNFKQFI